MADTTISPPVTFAGVVAAGLTYTQIVDLTAMLKRFADLTSPMDFVSIIEIGGGGGKTMRMANIDHLGSYRATALAGETSQPDLVNRVVGYSDISYADYGLAVAETFTQQIAALSNIRAGMSILQLLAEAPFAAYNLMRYLMAQLYTSIGTTVGAVGTRLSVDDLIAAQVAFNTNVPAIPLRGRPVLNVHPRQLTQIRESFRVEPSFVQNGQAMALQSVDATRIMPDYGGFGFDWLVSDEVPASGGGRYGGAYDRGGVGIAVARTQLVRPPSDGRIFVASNMLGLLIQEDPEARRQQMDRLDLHLKMGTALGDDNVYRQVAVISIDAA